MSGLNQKLESEKVQLKAENAVLTAYLDALEAQIGKQ